MKIIKTKLSSVKNTPKKSSVKTMTEDKFWQQIALQQQSILHAKHHT